MIENIFNVTWLLRAHQHVKWILFRVVFINHFNTHILTMEFSCKRTTWPLGKLHIKSNLFFNNDNNILYLTQKKIIIFYYQIVSEEIKFLQYEIIQILCLYYICKINDNRKKILCLLPFSWFVEIATSLHHLALENRFTKAWCHLRWDFVGTYNYYTINSIHMIKSTIKHVLLLLDELEIIRPEIKNATRITFFYIFIKSKKKLICTLERL